jgi:hypothetical protein
MFCYRKETWGYVKVIHEKIKKERKKERKKRKKS